MSGLVIVHDYLHLVKSCGRHPEVDGFVFFVDRKKTCRLLTCIIVFEERLLALFLLLYILSAILEPQIHPYSPYILWMLHAPFLAAKAVIAYILFLATADDLWLQLHLQLAHHRVGAGSVLDNPFEVKLMLLGQHIRLFYLADELRYSGVLILQVRRGERKVASAMLVFLQYTFQIFI